MFIDGAWGINFMSESDTAKFLEACSVSNLCIVYVMLFHKSVHM